MDQVIEAVEIGAAVLMFVAALILGKRMWSKSDALLGALEFELRQERCVEVLRDE